MNCIEFNDLLFSYIEGELDDFQKKSFENHMNNCSSCEKEYKAYQKMMNDIHVLPIEELPTGYCKKLHGKLEAVQFNKTRKKRHNYMKYIGVAASCVLVVSAIYFAGNNFSGYNQNKSAQYMDDTVSPESNNIDSNKEMYGSMSDDVARDGTAKESENNRATMTADNGKSIFSHRKMESKIIKSGRLDLQTLNFDEFIEKLDQLVRDSNGYFEYNQTSVINKTEDKEYKNANIKLRIPQESFYDVVNYIDTQADVYNRFVNEKDVTKEYYDVQNIVTNLQIQEDRLRELYDKAENITEILALENEIRRIRTEIDAYNINLSDIDDKVGMATIELSVTEIEGKNINIPSSKGLWSKAKEGFIRTVNNIVNFVESVIVWIVSYLPVLIPLAIAGFIIYRVVKKRIHKKS